GLTQKDLATRLGVPLGLVARWEEALADPAERLPEIAAVTGRPVPWFLGADGDFPTAVVEKEPTPTLEDAADGASAPRRPRDAEDDVARRQQADAVASTRARLAERRDRLNRRAEALAAKEQRLERARERTDAASSAQAEANAVVAERLRK